MSDGKRLTFCGKCHTCGTLLNTVLDGEEWCAKCGHYRRYPSHGWTAYGGWNIYSRLPDSPVSRSSETCPDWQAGDLPAKEVKVSSAMSEMKWYVISDDNQTWDFAQWHQPTVEKLKVYLCDGCELMGPFDTEEAAIREWSDHMPAF